MHCEVAMGDTEVRMVFFGGHPAKYCAYDLSIPHVTVIGIWRVTSCVNIPGQ